MGKVLMALVLALLLLMGQMFPGMKNHERKHQSPLPEYIIFENPSPTDFVFQNSEY